MYLKKLELNGFKSFASPAILEFSSGVTAIVGPNGSGKSNVADALRWILGEQGMKNIRSQNSADLIFSGSKSRNKLSKANVSLCFDNQSGCIPLDYSEIVVSRNIFRDGTSEYFINKNSAKLMDVVEMLAKANIGHRGFSVINQGMEAEILKYSPAELHELLEEASGVRYLQLKKRRSERRLKTTQTNIEKVSGILTELKPHLRYLKKEAGKLEKKEELKIKLENFYKQFFLLKLNNLEKNNLELQQEANTLKEKISKLKDKIFQLDRDVKQEENNIKENRNNSINAQKELEKILDERAKLSERLSFLRAEIQVKKASQPKTEDKKTSINLDQAEEEFKSIYSKLKKVIDSNNLNKIKKEIDKVLKNIEKFINLKAEKLSQGQLTSGWLKELLEKQKSVENLLEELNNKYEEQKKILRTNQEQLSQEKFFDLERDLRSKKDGLSELEGRFKEVSWLLGKAQEDYDQIKGEIEKAGINYEEIKNLKIQKEFNGSVGELEDKINHLKYKLEEIGGVDEITIQEYKETEERYETLTKKLTDLRKAKRDLEELIKELTKKISNQFEENFHSINDNFNKYFRLLFNGGRAYLRRVNLTRKSFNNQNSEDKDERGNNDELEEEEDNDEKVRQGIEIKATLPGKKVKDLRMFSGGEKALTSIALIFSIISSNPPPFLVLDEVDATLDESNARRFAKLISEFSKGTQFIVITHNRETMNQANILYGVTMGEDGVSTLLSLKLEK